MKIKYLIVFLVTFLVAVGVYSIYSINTLSIYDKTNEAFAKEYATSPDYRILEVRPSNADMPAVLAVFETANQKEIGFIEYTQDKTNIVTLVKNENDVSTLVMNGTHQTSFGAYISPKIAEDIDIAYASYYNEKENQSFVIPIERETQPYYFFISVDADQTQFEWHFLDSDENELFLEEE
ncbi:hypothetical protein [Alkalicoccobacillus murimartini]|uniref:DUF5590 domain-containing protein n=1 Tax=Alkalicoccobacillus murimartini TaxID=171685 RepID=A0ABT9YIH8_9BACI|nr:hypothetical protein [Alkalicoccobacillus murimartini]MDQ0207668.1 hypothetical protein [Alkalicoccobacillus murimartini]